MRLTQTRLLEPGEPCCGRGDEGEYPIPCRTLTMNVVLKLIDNEFLF